MSWSSRRAIFVLGAVAVFGTASVVQHVYAQRIARPIRRVPPGVGGVVPGGSGVPGVPGGPGTKPRKDVLDLGNLTLTKDDGPLAGRIQAAKDNITFAMRAMARKEPANEFWRKAIKNLQDLRSLEQDKFVTVTRTDAEGHEVTAYVTAKNEALRLIGRLPKPGRDFYEATYGGKARDMVRHARTANDWREMSLAMSLYLYTEAGAEAANWLGTYFLDRGQYDAATRCFGVLLQRDGVAALSEKTLLKSALAFHHAGDKARLETVSGELKKRGKEIKLRDEPRSPEEVLAYINKRPTRTVTMSASDVPEYRGGGNRNRLQPGGVPFLQSTWRKETVTEKATLPHLQQAERQVLTHDKPVLPAFFPVTATVERKGKKTPLVVYRNWRGVVAVELKTGKVAWKQESDWGMDAVLAGSDARKSQALNQWIQYFSSPQNVRPQILYENSVLGTLSANGKYVYAIEDLPVPPPNFAPMGGGFPGGGMPGGGGGVWGSEVNDAVNCNKLLIIDSASGVLKHELGGPGVKGDLADTYFLGVPLAVSDRLYALTEKQQELRLTTIDATTGKVLGFQALAQTKNLKLAQDPLRRTQGALLSYGEGILVVPTNAGAVFGVDLLSNSLLWAYPYHEEAAKAPAPGGPGMGPGMGGPGMGMPGGPGGGRWVPGPGGRMMWVTPMSESQWQVTAPVVQDGKVVFTAPDARSVHCVNLRDGTPAWSQPRHSDDLYLAGVFNGKVVIVGKKFTRAISLAKGDTLWELEVGLPSGQGAASALKPGEPSDLIYYLPLKKAALSGEPEICAINVDKGMVHAHTRSRKKDVPGNLLFYEGDMVSQTMTEVVAYPQLEVKLAELDGALKKDPNDPAKLTERGDYLLDKGDLRGAIDDFRKALANKPAAPTRATAKAKMYEALTELFQRDFNSAEKSGFVKLYEEMCKVDTPGMGEAEKAAEERRRRANFLCLVGKGKEAQGKLLEAFEKYLELGAGARRGELIQVVDEPSVRSAPDVWSGGRIAAMLAKAKDSGEAQDEARRVESEIVRRWKEITQSKRADLDALRKFVKVFGRSFGVGREARLALAERLMEDTDLNSLLEAEQHLQVLRGPSQAPEVAARAVEALARLNTRKGLLEDAAYYYDLLGRKYGRVKITVDGKERTGADFQEDLATDKRFWPYLDQPVGFRVPKGYRVKGTEERDTSSPASGNVYHFAHDGEDMPFFVRNQLGLKTDSHQLRLLDGSTGEERWSLPLRQTQFAQIASANGQAQLAHNLRFSYQTLGHAVVIQLGHMVFGVDPLNKGRVLWEKNLYSGPAGVNPAFNSLTVDPKDHAVVLTYPDSWVQRLGRSGPLQGGVVCLLSRESLTAVDPVTGRTLWRRSDINSRSDVFGDDKHLYVVNLDHEGNATSTRALRAYDGVSVRVREFAKAYQKRARMLGRNILVADTDPKTNALTLRIYDVFAGKDLWKEKFGPGAVVLRSEDPRLAGAVERNGQVRVVDLVSQGEVLKAKVDPAELNKAQSVHLVADKDYVYLAVQGAPDPNMAPWGGVQTNIQPGVGLRSVPVSGMVYCFHRGTGKLNWHNEAINQMMVVSEFDDMPVVLFTARYTKWVGPAGGPRAQQQVATGLAWEKRTGKLVWETESIPFGMYFHALNLDTRGKKTELIGTQMKVRFELVRKMTAGR